MPQYDEPLEKLQSRQPSSEPPADLDAFWAQTLFEARQNSWPATFERVDTGLVHVETFDVTFAGFNGEPVKAWMRQPTAPSKALPVVIQFAGYSGGRGLAHQAGVWPLAGYIELVVDTRGQGAGGGWSGQTEDPHGTAASYPGFMTRGIQNPSNYYYRRVIADAVLAVDAIESLPNTDAERIIVSGTSQGAGIALAAASLSAKVRAVMANVPFLCDFPRSVALAAEGPYTEIAAFLATNRWDVESVFNTLAYFDAALLGPKATAPALFSVALSDVTCPPSGVYAAYNTYGGTKSIHVYPFNDHEGGQFHQEAEQLRWLPLVLECTGSASSEASHPPSTVDRRAQR